MTANKRKALMVIVFQNLHCGNAFGATKAHGMQQEGHCAWRIKW
jgi:hypothetical protein